MPINSEREPIEPIGGLIIIYSIAFLCFLEILPWRRQRHVIHLVKGSFIHMVSTSASTLQGEEGTAKCYLAFLISWSPCYDFDAQLGLFKQPIVRGWLIPEPHPCALLIATIAHHDCFLGLDRPWRILVARVRNTSQRRCASIIPLQRFYTCRVYEP